MRIGIIAHLKHRIAEPFAGGLETHTHMLARGLRARGHEVVVFSSTGSDAAIGAEPICDETSLAAVGLAEASDVAFFKEHHAYLTLMNGLRSRSFDVIQNNSLHYLPVAMADAVPAPIVTTLHTPPFCWLESGVRLCRSKRARFVSVSRSVAKQWSRVVVSDTVIPNGIDLDRFAFRAEPDPEGYFAWSGRIVPEKGLHLAIDAARSAERTLRFAGPISDIDYFDADIRPRLGDDALYLGHLAHEELARLIGGASALLFTPRWEEPYGLVAAEALACGTPVAAFARGAIAEVVDPSCGVLAEADDASDLGAAALRAETLDRSAARNRAERHCDVETMISAYESLYRRIAASNDQGEAVPAEMAAAL